MSQSDSEQMDQDLEIVRRAARQLTEHFDSVQIFCTRYEPEDDGKTVSLHAGTGNWFSRFGQVCEWVANQKKAQDIDE